MNATTSRAGQVERTGRPSRGSEAQRHTEGPVARGIEEYTAQLPSDLFLWAAGASIAGSLVLQCAGRKEESNFALQQDR
jgi:hypothetical protein